MRHAVILAGGSGTRLWPLSRRDLPKQFAPLGAGGETLLASAIRRAARIADEVTIVTAQGQVQATREIISVLRDVPSKIEVIAEPIGRNTAAAIGLAAALIARTDPSAVLAILPADQRISDEAGFERVARQMLTEVERGDAIGTLGIVPTRAETGFGYLEVDSTTSGTVTPVLRFVEKPDHPAAERYLASGRYLWNAGIFFASAKRLLAELAIHAPATATGIAAIAAGTALAEDVYPTLPSISIDHAVMERAQQVVTIAASIGWDDLGSWEAIAQLAHGDARDNVVMPTHGGPPPLVLDTPEREAKRNLVMSTDDTLIVAYGVSDLVIVKVKDVLLVIPRSETQHVREIVETLAKQGRDNYL